MRLNIIAIGNSHGIRIPKAILEQCHIEESVEVEVDQEKIILKPCRSKPRQGWASAFKAESGKNGEAMLLPETMDSELDDDWQW